MPYNPGMPIYLIRHGQTQWNVEGRMQGAGDSPLTALGEEQVRTAAAILRRLIGDAEGWPFHCSPLGRARRSAALICETLGISADRITNAPLLREVDFGLWEGKRQSEIEALFPGDLERRRKDRWHFEYQGGESVARMSARARSWLESVAAESEANPNPKPNAILVAVTHGFTLRALQGAYSNLSIEETLRCPLKQGCVYAFGQGEVIEYAE